MRLGWVLTLGLLALGCSRPEAPTITPEQGTIRSISPAGIVVDVRMKVYNPNRVDLSARSVDAKIVLDGKQDIGRVTVPTALKLPANKTTKLEAPLSMKWKDVTALAMLAASRRDVPYDVEGKVDLGEDSLHFEVPFHLTGTITHEQLVQATVNSLPKIPFPGGAPPAKR